MTKKPITKVDELREALKAKKEAEERQKQPQEQAPKVEAAEEKLEVAEEKKEKDITTELEAAEREAKEHYEKLLRLMAEFENYKKRALREKEEHIKYANETLIKEILPVLDDFDRTLAHFSAEKETNLNTFIDGVQLIQKSLLNILQKFGLTEIDAIGQKFDPSLHDAVSCINSTEHEDDTVIEVHRKGYKLFDRVIRASQVVVAKKIQQ